MTQGRPLAMVLAGSADVRARWRRILLARRPEGVEVKDLDPAGMWEAQLESGCDLLLVEEDRDGLDVWSLVARSVDLGVGWDRIAVVLTSPAPPPTAVGPLLALALPAEPESLSELLLALDEALGAYRA